MKIKITLLATAVLLTSASVFFISTDAHSGRDNHEIHHYNAENIHSKDEAFAVLRGKTTFIQHALTDKPLDQYSMESVHEASYSLRAAAAYLTKQDILSPELTAVLHESIENVHDTSEDHDDAKLREAFIVLQENMDRLR